MPRSRPPFSLLFLCASSIGRLSLTQQIGSPESPLVLTSHGNPLSGSSTSCAKVP
ncbi:hypothetical protein PVAP13_5KG364821 [Panicum virgatum]|uniref:Uncharacterized protein n=1 Tax=Panicum virgatum TaxID=38727 RepID=A0A8T0SQB9_PANVG|nr:hypothetical protein PVAP13_5KG364821 [Panicum virgatum]